MAHRSGGSGGAGLTGEGAWGATAPLQAETEARGQAGQCATPGRLPPGQRHVQGGALASPASAFTLVSSPLTAALFVQMDAQRGAGACPRSHSQLVAE